MLTILHEDEHVVVVHKPAGLLVHRSNLDRHETRFAVQLLRDQLGREVHPAHRLDKPTSGALAFALDRGSCQHLSQQFEDGRVAKHYLAVVRGHPEDRFEIDHPLTPISDEPGRSARTPRPAQPALTRGHTLARCELPHRVDRYPTSRYALVALEPLTGRRHQLRRHLKHVSHPIVGDTTYGKGRHNRLFAGLFGSERLLLACTALAFEHPVTGQPLTVGCPLEASFHSVLDRLGWAQVTTATPGAVNAGVEPRRTGPVNDGWRRSPNP
jgi:tRNA pseudouridine65 synthase